MSRSDEVNKMTENVYKGILDQFNPSLKNFVTMGKHYEKALTGVTIAAKGYFDTLVKLGELASDSQGSKELGDTLFQMAEVHRQIQVQLEDVLKLFHSEMLSQLEQKLELDIKYLTATLKKYQSERKSKVESIERCQSQLKKLRRKSQASRHPNKYGDREMQYVELMSRRQGELDSLVAVGYRSALTEERRRYCFLVDRQCSVTKILTNYHCKVRELLSQKLSSWQQSCAQPTKLPERALSLLRHTAPQSSGGAGLAEVLRNAKLGITQPAEQRLSVQEVPPLLNGDSRPQQQQRSSQSVPGLQSHLNPSSSGHAQYSSSASPAHSQTAVGVSGLQSPPSISHTSISSHSSLLGLTPPLTAPHSGPLSRALTPVLLSGSAAAVSVLKAPELYSTSTLPLPRRQSSETRQGFMGSTLPRVLPLCAPSRVEALFPHSPDSCEAEKPGDRGGSSCLLSFLPGDALSLLISEPRDGWHYGQNERSGRKGWFPFSYTQPFPSTPGQELSPPALSKVNSSSMGQLDSLPPAGQMPQVSPDSEDERSVLSQRISTFRPRPYSLMNPETSRMRMSTDFTSTPPSPSRINPFAHIRLKKTVTNDRSAPLIQQSL
ncbi:brain-specific angiogenesis inhibitor 1-associated protein 2-like [Sinocyclocheilus rhinocerous]|uniref:brain-specific angiogenesis inhibitor 1-associated protein 2-like n=1 Tax=Sinocyclocheilus rhinocerous TaxID=307959 RepID=UPI0007B95119|nr:PREDICTED: brain-specific angiogenesis inhibitor 1-associated protein 2-like [Sinocyclocheilus rhinocerous]XP_016391265.1 PREDICTED: brain-specific angiogenesis inhibitor 1-associated protein 2-like [Sinocyclocheilus rhinocerous]